MENDMENMNQEDARTYTGSKAPKSAGKAAKGLGKGAKGLKSGAKRHKRVLKNNIEGVTKPAIRRLCRRGGIRRIGSNVYATSRAIITNFLTDVVKDSIVYTEHSKRKTVTPYDVVNALKRKNMAYYGGGFTEPNHKERPN